MFTVANNVFSWLDFRLTDCEQPMNPTLASQDKLTLKGLNYPKVFHMSNLISYSLAVTYNYYKSIELYKEWHKKSRQKGRNYNNRMVGSKI